jgi:predicted CXXCH cytochrome family protein
LAALTVALASAQVGDRQGMYRRTDCQSVRASQKDGLPIRPTLALPASGQPQRLDPAAWGGDHVGKPVPQFMTGDECLFCHREKVGTTWAANRHNLTLRPFEHASPARAALKESPAKQVAEAIKFVLGTHQRQRFLKPAQAYGQLELLSVEWIPPGNTQPGRLTGTQQPHWDSGRFGNACAGCHTTAVDTKTRAFAALSLDCYVCHGTVPDEHTKKPELAHLSPRRKDHPRVATSICAQCHVRMGKAKSTGLPYPNNFVAGDNLFRDFQVEFSHQELEKLSDADRHVLENVRDVVVLGKESMTCLSCHDVHGRSSKKHYKVAVSDYCLNCHQADGSKRDVKPFSNHNKTCGY